MPTGYTADVQDGKITTLVQFMRECARSFILDLRDEPRDAAIPRRSECQAHSVKHARARVDAALSEIHRLHGLSPADAEREALADYNHEAERVTERRRRREEARARYTAMLDKVNSWQPHEQLAPIRSFMVEQLTESIQFDCGGSERDYVPSRQTGTEWLAASIEALQGQYARAITDLTESEARQKKWDEFYGLVCDELARLEA